MLMIDADYDGLSFLYILILFLLSSLKSIILSILEITVLSIHIHKLNTIDRTALTIQTKERERENFWTIKKAKL